MLTGNTRIKTGWFGHLIIQVEEEYGSSSDPTGFGVTVGCRWRRATTEDLEILARRNEDKETP